MPPPADDDFEAYTQIRDECFKRISAHAADGEEFTMYVVPPLHFGLPVYNADQVFLRLYHELVSQGYQVFAWPQARRFFIAWYEETETAVANIRHAFEILQLQQQEQQQHQDDEEQDVVMGPANQGESAENSLEE